MNHRFFSRVTASIEPYTPGEQPKDRRYIKLNTNECPYGPSPEIVNLMQKFPCEGMRLYPDPDNTDFTRALAEYYGLRENQVLACGGSDEALAFAFMAFFNPGDPVYFPDISYGFYKVYAGLFSLAARTLPLREDFTMNLEDYCGLDGGMFIANPNAPTGIVLETGQIERVLTANPDRLVVVDEAYVDFAPGHSCIPLIDRYENLLVVQTFSKSRALAGMRLGVAFGQPHLIDGLNRIKYSFNPYNLDRVSAAVGCAALRDDAYFRQIVGRVIGTRERIREALLARDYTVLPSQSNFLFIRHPSLHGLDFAALLREKGILVRHFNQQRIDGYIRLTIGSDEEMDLFLQAADQLDPRKIK